MLISMVVTIAYVIPSSVGVWLCADICHRMLDAVNGIRLFVGNLDAELLLNRHHHFDRIQAVKTKIVREMSCTGDLQASVYIRPHLDAASAPSTDL